MRIIAATILLVCLSGASIGQEVPDVGGEIKTEQPPNETEQSSKKNDNYKVFGYPVTLNLELSAIPLGLVAILGLLFAYGQLRSQARASKASILLILDERTGQPVTAARNTMRDLNMAVDKLLANKTDPKDGEIKKKCSEEDIKKERSDHLARMMLEMRSKDLKQYMTLLDLCGLLETMGFVTRSKYIPLKHVYKLFGGIVIAAGETLERHIIDLQNESQDPEVYENFIWLLGEVRKISRKEVPQSNWKFWTHPG